MDLDEELQSALERGFEIEVEEEESTGYSLVGCPLCEEKLRRATSFGALDALIEHMNLSHHEEERSGRA